METDKTDKKQNKTETNNDKTENKETKDNSIISSVIVPDSNTTGDNNNETETKTTKRKNKVSEKQLEALKKLREKRSILKEIRNKENKTEKSVSKFDEFNLQQFIIDNSIYIVGGIVAGLTIYFFLFKGGRVQTKENNLQALKKDSVSGYSPLTGGGYLRNGK